MVGFEVESARHASSVAHTDRKAKLELDRKKEKFANVIPFLNTLGAQKFALYVSGSWPRQVLWAVVLLLGNVEVIVGRRGGVKGCSFTELVNLCIIQHRSGWGLLYPCGRLH